MTNISLSALVTKLQDHSLIPYLGPGALVGTVDSQTGNPIPADSESLILAMNNGRPMAPKLMYEFPRAAMNQELKRGRTFVSQFLKRLYADTAWTSAPLHQWLSQLNLPYIIDTNRDIQLQTAYQQRPHTLIVGVARIAGTDYRFQIYHYDGQRYQPIEQTAVDQQLPILFKPLGTPLPEANFIASDADYVDYITELMGGFAVPGFLKTYRKEKQYLLLGLRLTRDTERMILTDMIYEAADCKGWVLIAEPTDKERRFCQKLGLEIVEADVEDLLAEGGVDLPTSIAQSA